MLENVVPETANKKSVADFSFGQDLGKGAFGQVKLVIEKETNTKFAIKILEKAQIQKQNKEKYVMTERDVFNKCNHFNIVKLFYTFQDPKNLYFVIELCPNGELLALILKYNRFDIPTAQYYMGEIINGLEHLHSRGIIHRDLKPENILLGEGMHAKLNDFGTAKILTSEEESTGRFRSNSFTGTAEYVSPELLNDKDAGKSTDLWALACILFQMLAGKPPFSGTTQYQTFQLILQKKFEYPDTIPFLSRNLIDNLLEVEPEKKTWFWR